MANQPLTDSRFCLKCLKDLTDEMGCYIFVQNTPIPDDLMLCPECGNNGANGMGIESFIALVRAARRAGRVIRGFILTTRRAI